MRLKPRLIIKNSKTKTTSIIFLWQKRDSLMDEEPNSSGSSMWNLEGSGTTPLTCRRHTASNWIINWMWGMMTTFYVLYPMRVNHKRWRGIKEGGHPTQGRNRGFSRMVVKDPDDSCATEVASLNGSRNPNRKKEREEKTAARGEVFYKNLLWDW